MADRDAKRIAEQMIADMRQPPTAWAQQAVESVSVKYAGRGARRQPVASKLEFGDLKDTAPRAAHCDGCDHNVVHKSGVRVCRKACGCEGNMRAETPPITIQIATIISSSILRCRLGHF